MQAFQLKQHCSKIFFPESVTFHLILYLKGVAKGALSRVRIMPVCVGRTRSEVFRSGFVPRALSLLMHVIIPIIFGGTIYLLFRSRSLLMFRWINALGMEPALNTIRRYCATISTGSSNWIFYSLPDGLWVYSITAFMFIIWDRRLSRRCFVWIAVGPLLALGGEIGQGFGAISGTFDITDLIVCLIGAFLPLALLSSGSQAGQDNIG